MRRLSPTSCVVVLIVSVAVIVTLASLILFVGKFQRNASSMASISGVVTSQNMIVLPQGAIIRVALMDISIEDAPALTLREQNILHDGQLPAEFEIAYQAKSISPEKIYEMRATITTSAGVTLYKTTNPTPVLTQGHASKDLQVFVDAADKPVIPPLGLPAQEKSIPSQAQPTAAPLPGQNSLTGVLTYREDLILPAGAAAQIFLVDITVPDAPVLVIQKVSIPNPGQKPIPFGMPYYPSTIMAERTYALRAEIRDENGDMMFTNSLDYLVITQGRPTNGIELILDYVVKGTEKLLFGAIF